MNEPTWIEVQDALAIHELILSIHGGPAGVRDHARYTIRICSGSRSNRSCCCVYGGYGSPSPIR